MRSIKIINIKIIISLKLLILLIGVSEGSSFGECGAVIYKLPTSAKIEALGDAGAVVLDDITNFNYNPALLGLADKKNGVVLMYFDGLLNDTYFSSLCYKHKKLGISIGYLDAGKFKRYTFVSDEPVEIIKAGRDLYLLLAYAIKNYGISIKYLDSRLAERYKANSIGVDLGTQHKVRRINISVSLQNLGQGLKYISQTSPLPTLIRLGIVYNIMPNFIILGEAKKIFKEKLISSLASEYVLFNIIALRGGYKFGYAAKNISLGIGIILPNFNLDVAYSPIKDLDSLWRASVAIKY